MNLARMGLILLSILATACNSPRCKCGPGVPDVLVATARSGSLKAELLAFEPLSVGQNRVFYRLTDSNDKPLSLAQLTATPFRNSGSETLSSPSVNPLENANVDNLFEGLLVFNEPSSEEAPWKLELTVTPPNQAPSTVTFDQLKVASSSNTRLLRLPGDRPVLLTVAFPYGLGVGENVLQVTAHEVKDAGKSFEPLETLTFFVTPEMRSVGRGSSGNVAPTHVARGVYTGKVNFTLTGDWTVSLKVRNGSSELGSEAFDFSI